jgi:CubicO group peptidase (beta-lactamase class C family)
VKIDPDAAGMDAGRLAQVDEHLRRRYVEAGKIAGCQVGVVRHGQLAHFSSIGMADLARGVAVGDDTIWRIYSMTKPLTGVALMTLYERGLFQLTDPVSRFIPEFADLKVTATGDDGTPRLVEPERPLNVRDVMMHMSGFGYEMWLNAPSAGRGSLPKIELDLQAFCAKLATYPLKFHPGRHWLYSVSTDVCGRLVEVLSGQRFDNYLDAAIFKPLGMADTGFFVPDDKVSRFAACYRRNRGKELVLQDDPEASPYRTRPTFLSGGGGLVSTTGDYLRFSQMLASGGELDGVRILGRKSVELMASNHLPDGRTLREFILPGGYGEVGFDGMGFGLTMSVAQDPSQTGVVGSRGEFMWGGMASTLFWVDPVEDMVVVFMTQLIPSGTFGFRNQLKSMIYAAIVD